MWKVILEPEGKNPGLVDKVKAATGVGGEQTGGIVIYAVQDGPVNGRKEEVSCVGYVRKYTANPKVSFDKQLEIEVGKAKASVKALNDLLPEDKNRNPDGTRRLS